MKTKAGAGIDAVRLMRELRNEIDKEISGMSYEQQKRYIQDHLKAAPAAQEKRKAG